MRKSKRKTISREVKKTLNSISELIKTLEKEISLRKELQLGIVLKKCFKKVKGNIFFVVNAWTYRQGYIFKYRNQEEEIIGYHINLLEFKDMTVEEREKRKDEIKNTTLIYCLNTNEYVEVKGLKMDYEEKTVKLK